MVNISDPKVVSYGGTYQRLVTVNIFNFETRQTRTIGQIELDEFDTPIMYEGSFIEDSVHDRIIYAPNGGGFTPEWHVIDLKMLTIYRLNADTLNSLLGGVYITPNCKYIIVFR